MTDPVSDDGPPRTLLIAAVVVAVSALITVLGIAAARQQSPEKAPVAISSVPAPQADSPECRDLLAALPEQLGDFRRAETVEPTPPGAAAWQAGTGEEPVILRCGLERPGDFVVGTALQVVDAVQWFRIGDNTVSEAGPTDPGDQGRSTWYAVDRPVYVALTLPAGAGPTPIQQLSGQINRTMPARPIDPAPAR
ncbi:hypothetical protein MMAG44476_03477 [Mycolicibacterium mageritense DSM 44476 = CIP 104973]|uniref:Membrane protein n=1 Tax=Mycolicibacterium mageritense TaxID=53462 RepID=A0ABM7HZQ4_MYCME|nr:DUF3515 domain-containing protein [Mycolicibacterium mageritense]MCC9183654.1 DUF3515 domain-containing protein [Mycolicibacterium mageritense]BBX36097.1 membrane protein [Mycolicibacterium mageritense]GJJ17240.1 membrane protein [Mycolicibacterium mageritense]CDO24215.1 hypothetical protein BN978_04710 [Mycolicibacterium mageritense DSM 44476 = CIP 104973]